MTHAALVIQNGYRSYCENKRFKKSLNQSASNAVLQQQQHQQHQQHQLDSQCLQSFYKNYQHEQQQQQQSNSSPSSGSTSKEPSPSGPLKYEIYIDCGNVTLLTK